MQVRIRLFAQMAQQARVSSFSLDIPDSSTLGSIPEALKTKIPALRWPDGVMLAVNQEYAPPSRILKNDDEVAIIPPVSGG